MSWFDGKIPAECKACFCLKNEKWMYAETAECDDSCEYFLLMFPVIKADGKIDEEKMEILSAATENPLWYI